MKFYLYGAGINAINVIHYFGTSNILGIIDRDETRWGTKYYGVPVIPLDEYLDRPEKKPVVVTPYMAEEIVKDLEAHGVENIYLAPWMTNFFHDSCDVIQKLGLQEKTVVLHDNANPFLDDLFDKLKERSVDVSIYEEGRPFDGKAYFVRMGNERSEDSDKAKKGIRWTSLIDVYQEQFCTRQDVLEKFQKIHAGKRCFIIGNGPSLRMEDLDTLSDHHESCFGVNKIYFAFEKTTWRPDYYVLCDKHVIDTALQDVAKIAMQSTKFIRRQDDARTDVKELGFYEFNSLLQNPEKPQISLDIADGIYNGFTVVFDALQIAVYMGFTDIYFLGVDMTSNMKANDARFHFYGGKDTHANPVWTTPDPSRKLFAYACSFLKERGINLYNATRGGELEELPRADFDSLF